MLKRQEERRRQIKEYKEKRREKQKKFFKKTKKGQPVMKERMEVLLEKIMEQVGYKQ